MTRRLLWLASLLGLARCAELQATATANADAQFRVPFHVALTDGLDLEALSTHPPDLRVRRSLATERRAMEERSRAPAPVVEAACAAGDGECSASEPLQPPPAYLFVHQSDRLVAVDDEPIALHTIDEALDLPVGRSVVIPLFKAPTPELSGSFLVGFARIEILNPRQIAFEATTPERRDQVRAWRDAVERHRLAELARQQAEREREQARVKELQERNAQAERERVERERLAMTPHGDVRRKRAAGLEFRYEAEFSTQGPIGLNWDLRVTDRTVVSHVEPALPADRLGVIAPSDRLVRLNDVDTTLMGPPEVVQLYMSSTPPRRLVFLVAGDPGKQSTHAQSAGTATATATATATSLSAGSAQRRENLTMVFEAPRVLRDWRTRLHLAPWGEQPSFLNESLRLVLATPVTGCQELPRDPGADGQRALLLTYRGTCSFIEKAQTAVKMGAAGLAVINNVKGPGRFPAVSATTAIDDVAVPVVMLSKLDGELVMSVLEHEPVQLRIDDERPSDLPAPTSALPPRRLTNEEMVHRRDPKKAARALTFWYIDAPSSASATAEFRVLPALFGGEIPTMPLRVVMAYPQETACHPNGLGVAATRAVILVKRGGCSFGTKAKAVQDVGGAGMLLINSDDSLLPLMSDPKEAAAVTIWAASIGLANGTMMQQTVELNRNLPSLVTVGASPSPAATP
ncbi:hypothetical protein P43SY_003996 [Pythium insidiosum]|uniref:PA domain-containing protein n=1 Tax=Pythium insidiosum TaxID=114742 RepID=A0AAD5LJF9_PYTIN|nr:hypothetical protein P43SY_003996 [Pythium insidiosum]